MKETEIASRPLKLVYITDQLLPRNATDTHQFMAMINAFSETGCDISLLSIGSFWSKKKDKSELNAYYNIKNDFHFVNLPASFWGLRFIEKPLMGLLVLFSRTIWQADVVYTRNINNILPLLLFTSKQIFLETYRPLPDQKKVLKPILWFLKTRSTFRGIVVHSNYAANSFKRFGFSDEAILVEHNSFDLEKINSIASDKADIRRRFGFTEHDFILTYAGTIHMNKGLDMLFDVVAEVKDVYFLLIGSKEEGEFEQLAKKYPSIKVLPWMSTEEMVPILKASDAVFIPPSNKPLMQIGNTVLPIKTFVYLASGVPLIAPNTPDLTEILVDEENALLIEPNNVQQFIKAILRLKNDPSLSERISSQAKQFMEGRTWRNRAKNIAEFILKKIA